MCPDNQNPVQPGFSGHLHGWVYSLRGILSNMHSELVMSNPTDVLVNMHCDLSVFIRSVLIYSIINLFMFDFVKFVLSAT